MKIENGTQGLTVRPNLMRFHPPMSFLDADEHKQYVRVLTTPGEFTGWMSRASGGRFLFAMLNSRMYKSIVVLCQDNVSNVVHVYESEPLRACLRRV